LDPFVSLFSSHEVLRRETIGPQIRREAQLTMQYLDDGLSDGFDVLFMTPVSFYSKCDHFIQYVPLGAVFGSGCHFLPIRFAFIVINGNGPLP
jgi:hypothetical protein